MSLKAFHVLFVTICAMLSMVVGTWALDQHSAGGGALYMGFAAMSFVAAGGFLVYGAWFRRKLKDVSYL